MVVGFVLLNILYGFYLNLNYKNFDFGVNFNGVVGNKVYNYIVMSSFIKGKLAVFFNIIDFVVEFLEEEIINFNEVFICFLEDGDFF